MSFLNDFLQIYDFINANRMMFDFTLNHPKQFKQFLANRYSSDKQAPESVRAKSLHYAKHEISRFKNTEYKILYQDLLNEILLCKSVDNYQTYLQDIYLELLSKKSSKAYELIGLDINSLPSEEECKKKIEKKILKAKYDDLKKKLNKLNLKVFPDDDESSMFDKLRKYRNLYAHNRGKIDQEFIKTTSLTYSDEGYKMVFRDDPKTVLELTVMVFNSVSLLDKQLQKIFMNESR